MTKAHTMILLVVLGHENLPSGELSDTAKRRCSAAADLIRKKQIGHVMVTGAFGRFNSSDAPHSSHMILAIQVLLGASHSSATKFYQSHSAYTEEDIFAARRMAVDLGASEVIFLTSKFHRARVVCIAKSIFRDRQVLFKDPPDEMDVSEYEKREEEEKINDFKNGWMDAPLYSYKDQPFPSVIYEKAHEEHKHYDTLSLSVITASFSIGLFPHTRLAGDNLEFSLRFSLLASSFLSLLLFLLYLRYARSAIIGRRLMRAIELSWGTSGFSYNCERFAQPLKLGSIRIGTTFILALVIFALVIANVFIALRTGK